MRKNISILHSVLLRFIIFIFVLFFSSTINYASTHIYDVGTDRSLTLEASQTNNHFTAGNTSDDLIATAELSGSASICSGESADLSINLTGEGPWEVVYTDGDNDFTLSGITSSPHTFSVSPMSTITYEMISVTDRFNDPGDVSGSATITVITLKGGLVSGDKDKILLSQSTGILTLSEHEGTVTGWRRKINDGSWIDIPGTENLTTYSETPEIKGTYSYMAIVQNEECGTAGSEPFLILVDDSPVIDNASYDSSTGQLVIYGQNLNQNEEIDVKKLTISNGVNSFRFTVETSNVYPTSSTRATIVVEDMEKAYMNWIFNQNGLLSKDGHFYNLAAAENWNGPALEDPTSAVSVFNFSLPSIVSAQYNKERSELDVTASRLAAGEGRDIDATKFSISGKNGDTYMLTSETRNVNLIKETRFIIAISETDNAEILQIIDIAGTVSSTGHPYLLTVEDRWNTQVHQDYDISDPNGKQITAQQFDNQPPVATNVVITGSPEIGNTLAGSYTYFDLEGDPEGDSQYAWYRADDASGNGEAHIEGEDEAEYTITLEDANKFLAFEVTPVAQSGTSPGETIRSSWVEVENSPPSATNVEITGTFEICRVLTVSYDYFDPEDDPEGATKVNWFRADNALGANEEEIHQGNEYTLTLNDESKFIRVNVTPVASEGTPEGTPVPSGFYGPVENTLPEVTITGSTGFCEGSTAEITFNLSGTGPWTVFYTDGNDDFSFTADESPYLLPISSGGTYRVTSLTDADGCDGTELGDDLVLSTVPTVVIDDWYTEDFGDTQPEWVSGAPSDEMVNSWTYGQPDGNIFTSSPAGGNIWYTDILNADIEEQSWVASPCFDFRETKRPMIAIDIWREFGRNNDGAVFQYSTDNGNTWDNIGETGQGINWYNSSQIAGSPGGQQKGWTASDNGGEPGWEESRHDLDVIRGKNHVRFRMAYGSDGEGETNGGMAFDNIRIGERSRIVLLEHFTNATHTTSIESNDLIYGIANSKPYDFAYLSFHTSFPQADPFNNRNPADPSARALHYGISEVPFSIMDGGPDGSGIFNYSPVAFNTKELLKRALVDPAFSIEISQDQSDNELSIDIDITSLSGIDAGALTLYVAIVETDVDASEAGLQTNTVYRNIVRKLLPDAGGTLLPADWTENQTRSFNLSWSVNDVFDSGKLAAVAFIQDETTREVYQTGYSSEFDIPTVVDLPEPDLRLSDILLYPIPVTDYLYIQFRETTTNDHFLEIYNLTGRKVYSDILRHGSLVYEFNAGQLPGGIYLFRIRGKNKIIGTKRIFLN